MTSLKKKLMAAVSMLTVSGMMLTTASFAWFTISTNPEISGLTATVTVNENLEIALAGSDYDTTNSAYTAPSSGAVGDAGDYQTYGNWVDMTAYFAESDTDAGDAFDTTLLPATYYDVDNATSDYLEDTFYYPQYDDYGRVGVLAALTTEAIVADATSGDAPGYGNLYAGTLDADSEVIYGYYIDYFVKTNMTGGGDLLLSTATDRYTDELETVSGNGSYISYTTTSSTANADLEELLSYLTLVFKVEDPDNDGKYTYAYAHVVTTKVESDKTVSAAEITSATVESTTTYTVKYLIELDYDEEDTPAIIPITDLQENTDTLIRMYVYLEGSDMTNADALLGSEVGLSLNVQFDLDTGDESTDLDKSMTLDMSYTTSTT